MAVTSFAQTNQKDSILLFNKDTFRNDTLFIKMEFGECGEFGGSIELCKIFLKDTTFQFSYQKFQVDCNAFNPLNKYGESDKYGERAQKLIDAYSGVVSENRKMLIRNFVNYVSSYSNPDSAYDYGWDFRIFNSSRKFRIIVYPVFSSSKLWKNYLYFKNMLMPATIPNR